MSGKRKQVDAADRSDGSDGLRRAQPPVRACRICGCTDEDCIGCVVRTGKPCRWVDADLCSACRPYATMEDGIQALVRGVNQFHVAMRDLATKFPLRIKAKSKGRK